MGSTYENLKFGTIPHVHKHTCMMFNTALCVMPKNWPGFISYSSSKSYQLLATQLYLHLWIRTVPTISSGQCDSTDIKICNETRQGAPKCEHCAGGDGTWVVSSPPGGSRENRAQRDHRVALQGRAGYAGLPSNPISRKALCHLHPILLPTGNEELSSQFHPPVRSPPNTPWFKFQSPLTQQWHVTSGELARKGHTT